MSALRFDITHPARWFGGHRSTTTHVVWHATAGASAESSLAWLNRPNARETGGVASYHYVIERDGRIYQHAPHDRVAYHAGVSAWPWPDGAPLNSRSLGIAFANRQAVPSASTFEVVTEAQITAAIALVDELAHTYPALRHAAAHVRHRDVAPTRRADISPETLDWPRFVAALVARWREPEPPVVRVATWRQQPAAEAMLTRARAALRQGQAALAELEGLVLELEGSD